jgi:hypothetical protein
MSVIHYRKGRDRWERGGRDEFVEVSNPSRRSRDCSGREQDISSDRAQSLGSFAKRSIERNSLNDNEGDKGRDYRRKESHCQSESRDRIGAGEKGGDREPQAFRSSGRPFLKCLRRSDRDGAGQGGLAPHGWTEPNGSQEGSALHGSACIPPVRGFSLMETTVLSKEKKRIIAVIPLRKEAGLRMILSR